MKVLLLSPTYSAGGAERCAKDLFDHLPARGIETAMWVASRRAGDPLNVSSIRFPGERYLFPLDLALHHTDWRHAGSMWNLGSITPRDFDLVHFHNVHGHWLSIRALADLCRRMPAVWTMHDEWAATGGLIYDLARVLPADEVRKLSRQSPRLLPYHDTAGVRRLRRLLDHSMPQPRAIVAPSGYMKSLVAASGRFPGRPIHHIPNGLTLLSEPALQLSREAARAKIGVSRGPVVLMVAAVLSAAYKGIDLGLQVLGGIEPARRPTVVLMGGNAEALRAQLPGFEVVAFHAADSATLAAGYRAADVVLVPSRADNLPYIVLEAFACRTPVVAFGVGGIVEMLEGERGLLARPFKLAQLRAHVLSILESPTLGAELAERAFAWVTAECAMSTYLDRITAVYEKARR